MGLVLLVLLPALVAQDLSLIAPHAYQVPAPPIFLTITVSIYVLVTIIVIMQLILALSVFLLAWNVMDLQVLLVLAVLLDIIYFLIYARLFALQPILLI